MNTASGTLEALGAMVAISWATSTPSPERKKRSTPPINALPGVKASEYPAIIHKTLISAATEKLYIIVDSTFFLRAMPP